MTCIGSFDPAFDERRRLRSVFEEYEECASVLTTDQWAVVCLRYQSGFTEPQIAELLGLGRSAVNGRLQRARQRMEQYRRNTRAEAFRLARQDVDS